MTTYIFPKIKYDFYGQINSLVCYGVERLRDLFTFRNSDLIYTLSYVLMDNFCPLLYINS